jgi:hypothetical protein
MNAAQDPMLSALNEFVRSRLVANVIGETLERVIQQLDSSTELMEWEVVPLDLFGDALPENIRSCWIFVLRAGVATTAERHPNSHQRSCSLIGKGTFELREGADWREHPLVSTEAASVEQRWVSIPPSTWHRLSVGSEAWGMLSFHTVAPEELIEEKPVDPNNLEGETRQERYAGRR